MARAREWWRDVVGYKDYYQVSNLGRVRSVDRVVTGPRGFPKRLKGQIKTVSLWGWHEYLEVRLWKEGVRRKKYVHQLVAEAHIGPCPDGYEVRHGSADKLDNSVGNLCYGTRSDNQLDRRRDDTHGGRAVRRSDGREFINLAVAAEESGCHYQSIWAVCKGRRHTAGGFGWQYVDPIEDST